MQNSKTKGEAGLLVLVVFILGLLVGGVGNHLWGAHVWGSQAPPPRGAGHPPSGGSFSQRLGLTPDQQKQWDAIFKDVQPQFEALDAQHRALQEQTRLRFRAILTPDQQVKFDAIVKDRNSRGRGANRGGLNRGGPPPGRDEHGPGGHPGPGF